MPGEPIVVIGGSLAGLAAAARLAKAGHQVRLLERRDEAGGRFRPRPGPEPGLVVDLLPGVLTFPAPWRDLFRKSGRPMDAELARHRLALVPGPPARHRFADGSELMLPAERAEQLVALTRALGPAPAGRWRDLLDELREVWQALRPLGMEAEHDRPRLDRATRRRLWAGRSVADVAADLADERLAALLRLVAHRAGSTPEQTPAHRLALLSAERTFGRWVLTDLDGRAVAPSRLVELLVERVRLRRVALDLGHPVAALAIEGRRPAVTGLRVHGPQGEQEVPARAVISTLDPWQHLGLNRRGLGVAARFRLERAVPADAPLVEHRVEAAVVGADEPTHGVAEEVRHGHHEPFVTYRRRLDADRVLASVHDHGRARPDPSAGLAWRGWRSWWERPAIATGVGGLWTAGPHSRGGEHPSQVLLSGALASYATHDHHR